MKKLFISQRMGNLNDEEITIQRKEAIQIATELIGEPVEVLNTLFQEKMAHPLNYLGRSIEVMAEADIAFFAKGWETGRGCQVERTCAINYGIPIITQDSNGSIIGLTFGEALEYLKAGKLVTRKNWNAPGQCVAFQPGYPDGIPCNKQTADTWGIEPGTLFKCRPYMQLRCADGSYAMWVPSISDCLANDWELVDNK